VREFEEYNFDHDEIANATAAFKEWMMAKQQQQQQQQQETPAATPPIKAEPST
jgi:hypothetical protein